MPELQSRADDPVRRSPTSSSRDGDDVSNPLSSPESGPLLMVHRTTSPRSVRTCTDVRTFRRTSRDLAGHFHHHGPSHLNWILTCDSAFVICSHQGKTHNGCASRRGGMLSGSESAVRSFRAQYADPRRARHHPDASETFLPNLIHSVYTTHLSALLPHRLGLFLMILAIGSMVDLQHGPDKQRAEKFHSLARAALCEVPVMDDTSLDAVNALVSSPVISDLSGPVVLTASCSFSWYGTS